MRAPDVASHRAASLDPLTICLGLLPWMKTTRAEPGLANCSRESDRLLRTARHLARCNRPRYFGFPYACGREVSVVNVERLTCPGQRSRYAVIAYSSSRRMMRLPKPRISPMVTQITTIEASPNVKSRG